MFLLFCILVWGNVGTGVQMPALTFALRSFNKSKQTERKFNQIIYNFQSHSDYDSIKAYEDFYNLTDKEEKYSLDGVKPAYYTKIIYFLSKAFKESRSKEEYSVGYIMDQYTAMSINFLFNLQTDKNEKIKLNKGDKDFIVCPKNSSQKYKVFLNCVRNLAEKVCVTEDQIEVALFSRKKVGEWRQFLKSKYKN